MNPLKSFKFEPKRHTRDGIRLALYFNRLWQLSFNRKSRTGRDVSIPLKTVRKMLGSGKNYDLIQPIANIWLERITRGSNLSKKCSMWERRDQPHLNPQTLEVLKVVADANQPLIDEMVKLTSVTKNTVEIKVTQTLTFPTAEAAAIFAAQFQALLNEPAQVTEPQVEVQSVEISRARLSSLRELVEA